MVLNDLNVGVLIETKKPHACGGTQWKIVRAGADRTIECMTCGRKVVLLPDELLKRTRRFGEGTP